MRATHSSAKAREVVVWIACRSRHMLLGCITFWFGPVPLSRFRPIRPPRLPPVPTHRSPVNNYVILGTTLSLEVAEPGGAPPAGLPLAATPGPMYQHLRPEGRRQTQGAQNGIRLPGRGSRRRDYHPAKQRRVLAARAALQDPRGPLSALGHVHQGDGTRRQDSLLRLPDRGV